MMTVAVEFCSLLMREERERYCMGGEKREIVRERERERKTLTWKKEREREGGREREIVKEERRKGERWRKR